jgi:hypothetical protein
MVLVTTCGVALNVGVGDEVTETVNVIVGVGVVDRLSGARERAIKPIQ